ncbi:class I tRNA ligase family protein [uncultured Bradyrhizobium sp.]|uniref:class I tRNA ligase family protein n=1 Tax=uncultured Bradyrhizobium sp. TaxID=199684 RepID=UPI0035CB3866
MSQEAYIITLPPPTANGGLHVGHLSGPFLAADAFCKHYRLAGHRCDVTSYSDINQSYVRVTAERQKRDPRELARHWTQDIRDTLEAYGSDVDDFYYPDEASESFVRKTFLDLCRDGKIRKKEIPVFYSLERGEYLDEAGVSGYCPLCLAACKWGICEACAYINDATTLVSPRDTITGSDALELRRVEVLVFEMEMFRPALMDFYAANASFRPRYIELVRSALSRPLPDFPISVPGSWGIPLNHPELPGQVINAWAEVMAHLVWCYRRASNGGVRGRIVNFFGFDNSYFYGIVHAALLIASGQQEWLPHATINNEFYNLENKKFSTSNNYVIWAKDLALRHSTDAVRFYAAFNNPGFEKANFSENDMVSVLRTELIEPWHAIVDGIAKEIGDAQVTAGSATPDTVSIGAAILSKIGLSYTLEHFHLRQAAEDILHLLSFLRERLSKRRLPPADALFLVKCFSQAAYPIIPFASRELYQLVSGRKLELFDLNPTVIIRPLPRSIFERRSLIAADAA